MSDGTGYVNQGPDPRAGGVVGAVLARTQQALSFHGDPPTPHVATLGKTEVLTVAWPPFLSINREKDDGRFASFRIGWRYDKNWGRGGYVADVIIKGNMDHRVHY